MTDPEFETAAELTSAMTDEITDHYLQEAALFYVGLQLGRIADAMESGPQP